MPNFDIFLYDKPIETIMRWFGGLNLASDPYADPGTGPTLMRELKNYEPFDSVKKNRFGPQFTRLTSYQGSGDVTVIECATNLEDLLGVDDFISGPADANYIRCRNFRNETDVPRLTELTVMKQDDLVRAVLSHTGEGERSKNKWTFIERGQRQKWEDDLAYSTGQITEENLIHILESIGLNFESYVNQRAARIIEFGQFDQGDDLSPFEEEAHVIAPSIDALMSDDAFDAFFDE